MRNEKRERAALVGLLHRQPIREENHRAGMQKHLDELAELVDTAGAQVVLRMVQSRTSIDPAYFIGRGKAEELAWIAREKDLQLIVFDADLSPVQMRNLEKLTDRKIIDRSGIILDIFASRARTNEARTQVELAQLQYLLPRLTGQWTHLSKQYGGIGTKGPGETQIETDRRAIRRKISHLRTKLERIAKQRNEQRKGREQFQRVALVGYTNAGKSTLMKRLTGANVLVENRLFATLDSTVRLLHLSPVHRILLSDTVGFIRKLPHHLVASFKSTLDETIEADILLHVVDAAHPGFEEHIEVVDETLHSIGAGGTPVIRVFNKTDLIQNRDLLRSVSRRYPGSVLVSASRGINLGSLRKSLMTMLDENVVERSVIIQPSDHRILARIHDLSEIIEKNYSDDRIMVRLRVYRKHAGKIDRILDEAGGASPAAGRIEGQVP